MQSNLRLDERLEQSASRSTAGLGRLASGGPPRGLRVLDLELGGIVDLSAVASAPCAGPGRSGFGAISGLVFTHSNYRVSRFTFLSWTRGTELRDAP